MTLHSIRYCDNYRIRRALISVQYCSTNKSVHAQPNAVLEDGEGGSHPFLRDSGDIPLENFGNFTWRISSNFLHLVVAQPHKTLWRNSDSSNAGGAWNIAFFDQYLASSRKRYKIAPQLLWNVNRSSYMVCWTVPFLMTLSGPLPGLAVWKWI